MGLMVISVTREGFDSKHVPFPDPGPDKMFNVEKALVWSGDIVEGIQLMLDDGTVKELLAPRGGPNTNVTDVAARKGCQHAPGDRVSGRMLTTLNMWTNSKFYEGSLGCIIFGFTFDTKYQPSHVGRLHYITAIHEPNSDGIDAEWKAARKSHPTMESRDFCSSCTSSLPALELDPLITHSSNCTQLSSAHPLTITP